MSMPRTAIPGILALLVILLCCPGGPARPQNLLTNPDFDGPGGLDFVGVQTGSMVLGADSGSCATSGAIDATSGLSGGGDQGFWITSLQCIVVDPVTTPVMQLAGMYRTTDSVYNRIYLQLFSDTSCSTPTGYSSLSSADPPPLGTASPVRSRSTARRRPSGSSSKPSSRPPAGRRSPCNGIASTSASFPRFS